MIKKSIIISFLIVLSFSINVFADDSDYVDIGLSFNNEEFNNGVVYGEDFYLTHDDNMLETNADKIEFSLENGYRIQIGEAYSIYGDFAKAYAEILKFDSLLSIGFGNDYKIFTSSFTSMEQANEYKESLSDKTDLQLEMVHINDKVLIDTENLDIIVDDDVVLKNDRLTFSYDGNKYRGDIKFYVYDGNVSFINHLQVNDYLYGVVPREMDTDWPIEALKAQAVVARTYLLKNLNLYSKYGFNICSSSNCQAYGGYNYEGNTSNLAVDLTNGKIATYDGKIIYTYYHANSGGYTANSENVWSGSLPYLKAVYDPYSIGSPYSTWALSYTENELIDIINKNGYNCSSVTDMYIKDFSFDGRAQELIIETDLQDVVLIKESARRFFGYNELKSIFYSIEHDNRYPVITRSSNANMDISGLVAITGNGMKNLEINQSYSILGSNYQKNIAANNNEFNITGRGWGHGIGMSQYGAKTMAEEGFKYDEIIKFYYTGVEIN